MREKRLSLPPVALASYEGKRSGILRRLAEPSPFKLFDESDLYGLRALGEFLQYEIDGSFQTDVNEYMVQPFCLVFVNLDGITALGAGDPARVQRVVESVGMAFGRITRKADRAARFGTDFATLLRRTSPRSVGEFYVPRVTGPLVEAAGDVGLETSLSFGIAGHPDAAVRSVEDIFFKAIYALEEARRQGPGSVVPYDVKTMPFMNAETIRELMERMP